MVIIALHYEGQYYSQEHPLFETGYLAVEFFFILSGFLLCKSSRKDVLNIAPSSKAIKYTWKKIQQFYPALILAWGINILIKIAFVRHRLSLSYFSGLIKNNLENFLCLESLGFSDSILIFVTWYISALLIVGYFTYYLIQFNEDLFVGFIAPILVILIYMYYRNFSGNSWGLDLHIYYNGFITHALLRAIAGIFLGCLTYQLYGFSYKYIEQLKPNKIYKVKIGVSILEFVVLLFIYDLIVKNHHGPNNLRAIICFPILIYCSFLNKGVISRTIGYFFSGSCGDICLFFYLNHMTFIELVSKYLHQYGFWGSYVILLISLRMCYMIFSLIKRGFHKRKCFS